MSRFQLVELHSVFDHGAPHDVAMHALRTLQIEGYPGDVVKSVTDLGAISQATLDVILYKPPPPETRPRRRRRQPGLFE